MEAANTHDPIENAKGRFLPNRQLQEVGVISPMISDQVNKGKIVSNFIMVSRSILCQVEFVCHASYTADTINLI